MTVFRVKVSENGRLSLPAEVREAVGLDHGGTVLVDLDQDGTIRMRTVEQAVRRAQEIARQLSDGRPNMTVDDFIAERRREAQRED